MRQHRFSPYLLNYVKKKKCVKIFLQLYNVIAILIVIINSDGR